MLDLEERIFQGKGRVNVNFFRWKYRYSKGGSGQWEQLIMDVGNKVCNVYRKF